MRKLLLSTLLATAAYVAPALAGPVITVTDVAVRGETVTINKPVGPESVYAGPLTLTTSIGTIMYAWCVDLYHQIQTGSGQKLQYEVVDAVTNDNAPTPNTLSAPQQQQIANLAAYGQSLIGTAKETDANLTAVQLAIWTVEYPTFSYTGTDAQKALTDATLRDHQSGTASDKGLLALNGTQTFVTSSGTPTNAVAPVPEPATFAMLATGLVMLGAVVRRRA